MKNTRKIKVKFTTLEVGEEFETSTGVRWRKTLINKNFKGQESGEAICIRHDACPSQVGRLKYFNHVANAFVVSASI
jgi:hypothetical protein